MRPDHLRYIVIEGPIGVGKSSLAGRLAAHMGSELLREDAEQNPFLERFYRDPRGGALPAQLYFLFQRVGQVEVLREADLFGTTYVADFLLDKDRLFAQLTLDRAEFGLYEQIYARMAVDAPEPDLVVYLQAPVSVLLSRIAARGIPFEQDIDTRYLSQVSDAYTRFFYGWTRSPLLIVNAGDIDPVNRDDDFELLYRQICTKTSGRHYFNPGMVR